MTKRQEWLKANPLRKAILSNAGGELHGTMRAAAKRLEVSREALHGWFSGKFAPTVTRLDLFESEFGVSATEYLNWWRSRPRGSRR